MRSVGLDLGARHIAFCEVSNGAVVQKRSYRRFSELDDVLGPLDTTRVRRLGIAQHGRKNDAIDAEVIALAVDRGSVPLAHVLSPARRVLREKLSVRSELVEMRARQVTVIRGLARAAGTPLPSSATSSFLKHVAQTKLDAATRATIAPLIATLEIADAQLAIVDAELATLVADDSMVTLCTTVPGVGVVVAATFVSVLDDAKRFRNADAVASYFGLVPSETTTGGPGKRRLGSITKQGNTHARCMLVQAAWQLIRVGPKEDPLRMWAMQLAARRGKKIAAIALARRLATVLWAMCRDGAFYDPAMAARDSEKGLRDGAEQRQLVADAVATVARKLARRIAPLTKRASKKKMSPEAIM